jgi:autotransporter-associated beta strand protein
MKLKFKKIIFILSFIVIQQAVAQAPIPHFWQLNKSPLKQLEPLNDLVWDNKWFNRQIDNGNGNWNLTEANWSPNINNNIRWIPCRNAIFGGNTGVEVPGIVAVVGPMATTALYFKPGNGNFALQGGSITSASCGTALLLDVASGLNPYIFASLTGTNAVIKENAGTAFLLGTNTYTGTTTVNAGMLSVGAYGNNMTLASAGSVSGGNKNPLVINPYYNGLQFEDGFFYDPVYVPAVPANDGDVIYFYRNSTYAFKVAINRTNLTTQYSSGTIGSTIWFRYDALSNLWISMGLLSSRPTIAAASNVVINSQATMQWDNNYSNTVYSVANTISGTGNLVFRGQNATNALQTSWYQLAGNNIGYSGNLIINRAMLWNNTDPKFLGSSTVTVQDRGTISFNGGIFDNTITIEEKAGWHTNLSSDSVLGAIRLEGTNTLNGNIVLNNPTNTVLGDGTGQYAAIGGYNSGTHTLSGIISGNGNLSMSRYTGHNGGTYQTVNIKLTGINSNTFIGKTVINGQGSNVNLLLMKTSGARTIPANSIVEMGNNTNGQANLRMGDDQNTGATIGASRNQWDNQFGENVLMDFKNASGQWMRFDLQGTNQTLAGIICGNETTQGGGVVQNQNYNGFNINNHATLTLNGSDNYIYNGVIRDQESGVGSNKLSIIKSGIGTQTFIGSNTYSGGTIINGGKLKAGSATSFGTGSITLNAGATLDKGGYAIANVITNNGGTVIP